MLLYWLLSPDIYYNRFCCRSLIIVYCSMSTSTDILDILNIISIQYKSQSDMSLLKMIRGTPIDLFMQRASNASQSTHLSFWKLDFQLPLSCYHKIFLPIPDKWANSFLHGGTTRKSPEFLNFCIELLPLCELLLGAIGKQGPKKSVEI